MSYRVTKGSTPNNGKECWQLCWVDIRRGQKPRPSPLVVASSTSLKGLKKQIAKFSAAFDLPVLEWTDVGYREVEKGGIDV